MSYWFFLDQSNLQTVLSLTEKTQITCTHQASRTYEITSFRTLIRQKQYFQQTTLTTLSNKPTNSKLFQYSEHAQQIKYLHCSHITTNKLSPRQKRTPIFILQNRQKHSDIANKTKADIILNIQTQLNDMDLNTLFEKLEKIKTVKKSVLLVFVREIYELKEDQSESEGE